jgi:hypothetical protein
MGGYALVEPGYGSVVDQAWPYLIKSGICNNKGLFNSKHKSAQIFVHLRSSESIQITD